MIKYKTASVSEGIKENDRFLAVVHQLQCKYFSSHDTSASFMSQGVVDFFKSKKDQEKLRKIAGKMSSFLDSYCSGKENLNPESLAGRLLGDCRNSCRQEFASKLEAIGKYGTDESKHCEYTCDSYTSRFSEIPGTVIETMNIKDKNSKSASECNGMVSTSGRSKIKKSNDVDATVSTDHAGSVQK